MLQCLIKPLQAIRSIVLVSANFGVLSLNRYTPLDTPEVITSKCSIAFCSGLCDSSSELENQTLQFFEILALFLKGKSADQFIIDLRSDSVHIGE